MTYNFYIGNNIFKGHSLLVCGLIWRILFIMYLSV
jgi:hypothetical protein